MAGVFISCLVIGLLGIRLLRRLSFPCNLICQVRIRLSGLPPRARMVSLSSSFFGWHRPTFSPTLRGVLVRPRLFSSHVKTCDEIRMGAVFIFVFFIIFVFIFVFLFILFFRVILFVYMLVYIFVLLRWLLRAWCRCQFS